MRLTMTDSIFRKAFVKPSKIWRGCVIDSVNTWALTRYHRLEQSSAINVVAFQHMLLNRLRSTDWIAGETLAVYDRAAQAA